MGSASSGKLWLKAAYEIQAKAREERAEKVKATVLRFGEISGELLKTLEGVRKIREDRGSEFGASITRLTDAGESAKRYLGRANGVVAWEKKADAKAELSKFLVVAWEMFEKERIYISNLDAASRNVSKAAREIPDLEEKLVTILEIKEDKQLKALRRKLEAMKKELDAIPKSITEAQEVARVSLGSIDIRTGRTDILSEGIILQIKSTGNEDKRITVTREIEDLERQIKSKEKAQVSACEEEAARLESLKKLEPLKVDVYKTNSAVGSASKALAKVRQLIGWLDDHTGMTDKGEKEMNRLIKQVDDIVEAFGKRTLGKKGEPSEALKAIEAAHDSVENGAKSVEKRAIESGKIAEQALKCERDTASAVRDALRNDAYGSI